MAISESEIAFVQDIFQPLGTITHRHMMGGLTLYFNGTVFAILDRDSVLFLKAKGAFAEELEKAGSRQFAFGDKRMCYWTMPEAALDDPELASDWAKQALSYL